MEANKTVLQMKYARIVKIFADKLHMPYEDALDFFYNSSNFLDGIYSKYAINTPIIKGLITPKKVCKTDITFP